jgi:MFS family permease
VSDLVEEEHLTNAVALNSTSFNAARLIGPASAGLLIAAVGSGWVFMINAVSFAAVLVSLSMIRTTELNTTYRAIREKGSFAEGFRYVWKRPDLKAVLTMFFLIGTFGFNFAIFISTMTVTVFHMGSKEYGLLSSFMAVGSVTGALLAARRSEPRLRVLFTGAALFGAGFIIAALMPTYALFALTLIAIGVASQTFSTTANSIVQLSTSSPMRGRVMAIFMAVAMGGTPIGAPIVGYVADTFGPRWALGVGAFSGISALAVGIRYLVKYRNLKVRLERGRLAYTTSSPMIEKA